MTRTLILAGVVTLASVGDAYAQSTLQRCLGIVPGQSPPRKIGPSPATMTFCRQLPAWDAYEQAGERFKAGDHSGAATLLGSAAKAGNPVAQVRLAMMHEAGDGVPKSGKETFGWYRRAAEAGEPMAQSELGGYFEVGDGVAEDWVQAAGWYQKSAEQGWLKGQFSLARAYQYGIGVPLNLKTAIAWYERAAAQGHSQAAYFAKYLRDNHGLDGSSRNQQEQAMLGPLIGRIINTPPPVGTTFRNSGERLAYLRAVAQDEARTKARIAWETKKREYEDCRSTRRGNCYEPGPAPR